MVARLYVLCLYVTDLVFLSYLLSQSLAMCDLELTDSKDPPTSSSREVGTKGVGCCAQLCANLKCTQQNILCLIYV